VINGHACFWLTVVSGNTVSLIWPEGSVARDKPLRVEDKSGRTIARVGGDPSALGGNSSMNAGCHPGSIQFFLGAIDPEE
jgi:hypothetical protein